MLAVARRRVAGQGIECARIDFIRADALTWNPPDHDYDLIVTHFFLDCFRRDQLEALIGKLTRVADPQANWLLADFQSASAGWRRRRSEIILWMMYRFFTIVTRLPAKELIDPASILEQNGFKLRARDVQDWDLLHSDWWQQERGIHSASLA
jgi:ubiquinone/menaquinone biosynthesis C-methylase UbiE